MNQKQTIAKLRRDYRSLAKRMEEERRHLDLLAQAIALRVSPFEVGDKVKYIGMEKAWCKPGTYQVTSVRPAPEVESGAVFVQVVLLALKKNGQLPKRGGLRSVRTSDEPWCAGPGRLSSWELVEKGEPRA